MVNAHRIPVLAARGGHNVAAMMAHAQGIAEANPTKTPMRTPSSWLTREGR